MTTSKPTDIRELIGTAIGEASMCWSETPSGVFEYTRVKEICDKLYSAYEQLKAENLELSNMYKQQIEKNYSLRVDNDDEMTADIEQLRAQVNAFERNDTHLRNEISALKARLLEFEGRTYSENQQLEVNRQLSAENERLREQAKDYEQVLKYYGDKSKWFEKDNSICIDDDDTELSDYVKQLGADEYGGKRARGVLKKWGLG